MTRRQRFERAVAALGSLVVGPTTPHDGWPGHLTVATPGGNTSVALHVSGISPHARRDYEMRFQNPASATRPPVSNLGGSALPVLLGTDDELEPRIFVAADGRSRLGNANRFSLLFNKRILAEAEKAGWAVYESSTGEEIYAFVPSLFPVFLELIKAGEVLAPELITEAALAAGVLDDSADDAAAAQAAKRATKAVTILVRKAGAGRKIRAAYAHKCAMCGIGSNLLAGAHIFPVEAPGSTDEVWNGLSLCHNHHSAFDQHLIWVDPESKAIHLHPSVVAEAAANVGTRHFVDSTLPGLAMPAAHANRPRRSMFERRYAHYGDKYEWVNAL